MWLICAAPLCCNILVVSLRFCFSTVGRIAQLTADGAADPGDLYRILHVPAAGEEPWEEIAAKTGQSVSDVLLKKLAFKRGERDAKKLEAMAPLCKELR